MRQFSMAILTMSGLLAVSYMPMPVQAQTKSPEVPTTISKPSSDVYFINRAKNLARQAAIQANGGLDKYRPNPAMYGPAVQTSYVNNTNGSITFTFTGGTPGSPVPSIETVATVMPDGSVKLDYNGAVRGVPTASATLSNPSSSPSSPPSIATASNSPAVQPIIPADKIPSSSKAGLPNLSSVTPISSAPSSNPTSPTPISPTPISPTPISPTPISPTSTSSTGHNSIQGASFVSSTADQDAFLSKARNVARQTAIKENGGLARYRPEASMFGPSGQSPYVKNADGSVTFTFKGSVPGATEMTVESVVTVSTAGIPSIQYNGPVR